MKFLGSVVLAVATLSANAQAGQASDVYLAQAKIIAQMNSLYPSVQVDVRWEPCRMLNSFYSPGTKTIVLCTEIEDFPEAALGFAAHEMGHAITEQLTDTTSEQDADEVMALSLVKFGHLDGLMGLALWELSQEEQAHQHGDSHPGWGFRAWEAMCIATGSEATGTRECRALYQGLRVRWNTRLAHP